jgi:S1-C subfamily serine protease
MKKKLLVFLVLLALPALALALAGYLIPTLGKASAAPVSLSAETVFDALEATLGQIYKEVTPSVVNIQVVKDAAGLPADHPDIPGLPSDPSSPGGQFQQQGLGSGFVWDQRGHIVTNNHVVDGATKVTVTFYDDTTVPAEVVGTDPHSDLAVLKVDLPAGRLQPVQIADSTQVEAGQLAVAIGNPFGLEGTMTVGFVSALGRSLPVTAGGSPLGGMMAPTYTIPDIIQTDAPINPGNSGGVLVNDGGQVIGVPTAIESPVRANAGIGFAVPAVIVEKVVPVLIREGHYEHPWLGISGASMYAEAAEAMNLDSDQRGVLVVEVVDGGPADSSGLQGSNKQATISGQDVRVGGDLIVAIDGQPVEEFEDLVTYLARHTDVGQTVTLELIRDGREESTQVTLAARPQEEAQAPSSQFQAPEPTRAGAWLGIRGMALTTEIAEAIGLPSDQQGILIQEVIRNSPADQAGLLGGSGGMDLNGQQIQVGGDVIIAMDGAPISDFETLRALVAQSEPGQETTITLLRDGEEIPITVTLGERPASMP